MKFGRFLYSIFISKFWIKAISLIIAVLLAVILSI